MKVVQRIGDQQKLVQALRDLTKQAEKGALHGIGLVAVYADHTVGSAYVLTRDRQRAFELIGALTQLTQEICHDEVE